MRASRNAVTLIELMVVSTITMTVSAGVFALLNRAWQNHDALLTQNLVQREARAALEIACNEMRSFSPWTKSYIVSTSNAQGSVVGQSVTNLASNSMYIMIYRDAANHLVRVAFKNGSNELAESPTTVHNISAFSVTYLVRVQTGDGSIQWLPVPRAGVAAIDNDPSGSITGGVDPRIESAVVAIVTVTASCPAKNAQTYSCTLSATVKMRNQTYHIVPPMGG